MQKLEIKKIKGNKYIYIKYNVKVNNKNAPKLLYVGRLEKLTLMDFMEKLNRLHTIRLMNFINLWENKKYKYLDSEKIFK